ncbi:MAG TPA: hypothetical protein VFN62_12535, partial [Acidobacteriaceae bacterium]|nr:hypothetical protein [Acidobacteriaceae bacterium]
MEYLKLRTTGRWIAAVCVLGLGSTLMAQNAATSSSSAVPAAPAPSTTVNPSRADIFLGYSYLAPHGYVNGARYASVNLGAIGSGAYYFSKYMGFEAGLASHPDGPGDGFTTINAGPIARFPLEDGLTPFLHGLVGTTRIGGPNYVGYYSDGYGPINFVNPYRWGVSLTAGGGMDFPLPFIHHKLSWRVFQADYQYMHASFGSANNFSDPKAAPVAPASRNGLRAADSTFDPNAVGTAILGGRANINAAQLSTGLVYHIGSILPPPPVAYSCSVSPTDVYPGDQVTVTGNATNL